MGKKEDWPSFKRTDTKTELERRVSKGEKKNQKDLDAPKKSDHTK